MKLKDLKDVSRYLQEDCYCPNEIYSFDGFFFQLFSEDTEIEMIGERNEKAVNVNADSFKCCFARQNEESDMQILIIFYESEKVVDILRVDATENNIRLVKELLKDGNSKLKFNVYENNHDKEALAEIMAISDAVIVD